MQIVLSILEILGWTLLILLAVLLFLLALLLFCRLRYVVEGEYLEEKWARFKAHWLFRLVRAKISYGDDLIYGEIHIFWKKITFSYDLTAKKEEEEESLEETDDDFEEMSNDTDDESVDGVLNSENEVSEEQTFETEEGSDNEQSESIVSKIKGIIERIKQIYLRSKKILADEKNKKAVIHLKDELLYLLKILSPKKSKIDAAFSTGSPDTTGQLFGVLACFPAMYQKNWKLIPDFQSDEFYFKGTFWGKGWIALYQICGIVLRIVFDKNCRRLYTMIKKFKNWLKKDDKSQEEK